MFTSPARSKYRAIAALLVLGLLAGCSIIQPAVTHFNDGLELYQSGDYEAAVTEFDQSIERNPEYGEAYAYRGVSQFRLEDFEAAQPDLDRAIELGVTSIPEVYASRGIILSGQGDDSAAIEDLNQALAMGLEDAQLQGTRAITLHRLEVDDLALEAIDAALDMDSGNSDFTGLRGVILYNVGEEEEALDDLDTAIEDDSENPEVYYTRALILGSQDEVAAALDDLDKAIELDDQYAEAYVWRANLLFIRLEYDDALDDIESAFELGYEDQSAYFLRGRILFDEENDVENALADFNQAITLGREQADVHTYRGQAMLASDEPLAAMDDFNHAIELDAEYGPAYRERGLLYFAADHRDEALSDLNMAVDLGEGDEALFNARGDLNYLNEDYEQATLDYISAEGEGDAVVTFADDFRSSGASRFTGRPDREIVNSQFVDGQFEIGVLKPYYIGWSRAGGTYGNVIMDVDTTLHADPGYEYEWSLLCRVEDKNFYQFVITSRGRYAIIRHTDYSANFLSGWSTASVINKEIGDTNHLTVSCIDDKLTLEVNGTFLAEATDDDYSRGDVAMAAGTFSSIENHVRFDNLIVRSSKPEIGELRGVFDEVPDHKVLVVCDNIAPANEDFCSAAALTDSLVQLGYETTTYTTLDRGIPTASELNQYDVVFWSLGDDCCDTPSQAAVDTLTEYLRDGGQLVIDGGSIASAWPNSTFLQSYLRADHAGFGAMVDVVPADTDHPLVAGLDLTIDLKRAPFPPDVIKPRSNAVVILERGPKSANIGQPAMIAFEEGDVRVIFSTFPLKELPGDALLQFLDNAMHWFKARAAAGADT